MNAFQTRYAVARAHLDTLRAELRTACPQPAADADEATWDAHFDAEAATEIRLGIGVAEHAVSEAEDAMVRWSFDVARKTATGSARLDVETVAAKWPRVNVSHRARLVDLALRLAA